MSLKSKFKTSSTLVREGVWFDVCENSDKTKCRVRLRRSGRGNPQWSASFRAHTANRDMDNITPDEDEQLTAEIFAEANVVEWEHLQPNDDGTELEFTVENAKTLLCDPDWVDLLKDWQTKASTITAFQQKRDAEAGK